MFCDTASLTSVNLLKVLLAERGLKPEFKPLENYQAAAEKDFVLLIGDRAIDFQRAPHPHEIFDLGAAWFEMTNLPFVFAVWALRRGLRIKALRRLLRETKKFGMETLDVIIPITRPTTSISGKDYSTGRSITTSARTRSAASRNSANCSASTASARCMSRSL